ncbi:putative glutathione S-transferase [Methylohalomonas lacus]|uniref:Glutathione S-transferase n=1 Tax=Methylohalomonas lacus TaxID=398773 RepID=A0AAE3L5R2_9GAMM|nr:glutathione S-transferase family protein [Methylohalomonas lacus]MCS3903777.1 putative glutathione S-transferase [Methylohalomonas lacus]
MGLLIDGQWHDQWYDTEATDGRFVREDSQFRNWVTADGSNGFPAAANRYHLYVSLACPWAHRTLIFRRLKKLEDIIGVSVVNPYMGEHGWTFIEDDTCVGDRVNHTTYLHELYTLTRPDYTGRVTVPVLWDKQQQTIVSNESAEIIRMLNRAFDAFTDVRSDFYPEALQTDIDAINETVYHNVNNGVYRCGFATRQQAYEEAFDQLFTTLDELEARLAQQRYLVGERLTEADWRLFTTLVRFDAVYVGHFKCNKYRIADYPNLANYLRELYQFPGVEATVNFRHIKRHYYTSHASINPTGIVPAGPAQNLSAPHDRECLPAQPLPN